MLETQHPTLRAIGVGGLIGGLISTVFLGWTGVVIALVLFVGTALIAAVLDSVRNRNRPGGSA